MQIETQDLGEPLLPPVQVEETHPCLLCGGRDNKVGDYHVCQKELIETFRRRRRSASKETRSCLQDTTTPSVTILSACIGPVVLEGSPSCTTREKRTLMMMASLLMSLGPMWSTGVLLNIKLFLQKLFAGVRRSCQTKNDARPPRRDKWGDWQNNLTQNPNNPTLQFNNLAQFRYKEFCIHSANVHGGLVQVLLHEILILLRPSPLENLNNYLFVLCRCCRGTRGRSWDLWRRDSKPSGQGIEQRAVQLF